MEFPKIVLGLKADKRAFPANGESSDDGNFFGSYSDNKDLFFTKATPLYSIISSDAGHRITTFTDASARITPIVTALKEYKIPDKKFDKIVLIPENVLDKSDDEKITAYIENKQDTLDLAKENYDDVFVAQFEIIEFYKKKKANLKTYASMDIDSRALSLLHFCIAKQLGDKNKKLFHFISAVEEALKYPSYAPLSALFDDYGIPEILEQISTILADIFPKHPILPSVLHSLAEFNKNITKIIEKLENQTTPSVFNYDDDDDDDDSFFEFLKQNRNKATTPQVQMLIEEKIVNPLDFSVSQTKQETLAVSVTGPPETMTYYLDASEEKVTFSATQFSDWIMSMRKVFNANKLPTESRGSTRVPDQPNPLQFSSVPSLSKFELQSDITDAKKHDSSNPSFYFELYKNLSDQQKLLSMLPNEVCPEYFHLYYPVLQFINSNTKSACIKKGCQYPKLIALEQAAHQALLGMNSDILTPLQGLLGFIPEISERSEVAPLEEKRPFPSADEPFSENIVNILAACDVVFLINGRSPLTGARVSAPPPINSLKHPILVRAIRASYLYKIYSTMNLPPYFAFRVGFAISLVLMEIDACYSCRIMFELVYLLHSELPLLTRSPIVRNAVLFFAETLERSDRYYHACLVFDNYFLSNINDSSSAASAIAQIAQRNGDTVRAAFFYTESIKKLIQERKYDESLYLGQIIAQIYVDNGLLYLALSILSYLLKNTYPIQVYQPKKVDSQQPLRRGTLRVARQSSSLDISNFTPSGKSINTMLVCCSYIDILIRCRMYKTARETLQILENSMDIPLIQSVTSYLKSKIYVRSNKYDLAVETLPSFTIKNQQRSATHISLLSGTSFDASTAILKMMASATIDKLLFKDCIVWSEIIIQAKSSLREVGAGFMWRGMAYAQAIENSHIISKKVDFRTELSEPMKRFVHYDAAARKYNEIDIINEAISSFSAARICFERVGSIKKETEAALRYADILLQHFFDPSDPDQNSEALSVFQPILETSLNNPIIKKEQVRVQERTIDKEACADEVSRILNFAEKNAGRIMCPQLILYVHTLQAKVNLMKKNMKNAKTYFDFAFATIQKYSNGPRFAIKSVSTSLLRSFERPIDLLCDLLIGFENEFINDHLVLFDILCDLRTYIDNRIRNVSDGINKAVVSEVDMDVEALSLKNVKLPSFLPVLQESGYIKSLESEIETTDTTISTLFRLINSNIRLFETGKLSEDMMHMRNKQCCHQLEKQISMMQTNNRRSMILDTKFSTAQRHLPSVQRIVLVQHILHGIFVYVPSTGQKNILRFKADGSAAQSQGVMELQENEKEEEDSNVDVFNFKIDKHEYSIPVLKGVLPTSFFKSLISFILVDKKGASEQFTDPMHSKQVLDLLKEKLFGKLLLTCQLLMHPTPIVKDKMPELDNPLFKIKKGRLATIDPGLESSINFVVSSDLRALPLELIFRENLVIRCPSFSFLIQKRLEHASYPINSLKLACFRRVLPPDVLREAGINRSIELIRSTICTLGSGEYPKPFINEKENTIPYPFPLYSSNKTTDFYNEKYPFCIFQEIKPLSPLVLPPNINEIPYLFIFTYSDLCSFPLFIDNIMEKAPLSFFMFIPAGAVRKSFELFTEVFKRQENRLQTSLPQQRELLTSPEKFVASLQLTLIRTLSIPVPLFMPITK